MIHKTTIQAEKPTEKKPVAEPEKVVLPSETIPKTEPKKAGYSWGFLGAA